LGSSQAQKMRPENPVAREHAVLFVLLGFQFRVSGLKGQGLLFWESEA